MLVVDAVPEQAEIAASMLRELGYEVVCAASGEQALELMHSTSFDVVVLDMIMAPGIDGLQTYRRMLELRPGQRAVIVSGYADSDRIDETLRVGAGCALRKPFLFLELGAAVRRELDREADGRTDQT